MWPKQRTIVKMQHLPFSVSVHHRKIDNHHWLIISCVHLFVINIVKPDSVDVLAPILAKYKIAQEANRILYISFTSVVDYMWLLRATCECLAAFDKRAVLYLAAAVSDFYIPSDKMVRFVFYFHSKTIQQFVIEHFSFSDQKLLENCSQRTKCNQDMEHQQFPYNLCQKCWLRWSVCGCRMRSSCRSN